MAGMLASTVRSSRAAFQDFHRLHKSSSVICNTATIEVNSSLIASTSRRSFSRAQYPSASSAPLSSQKARQYFLLARSRPSLKELGIGHRNGASSSSHFSIMSRLSQASTTQSQEQKESKTAKEEHVPDNEQEFAKSGRAAAAAEVNLSAKLSKDGGSTGKGWGEIRRLFKIARPEAKALSIAVAFLIISSTISMAVPASIGKILDFAASEKTEVPFGLDLTTFYALLGGILTIGALANYGRVVMLRIIGERVVTRMRAQLFRNTYVQNAEFFDANRTGDLISRLGSDTIIVGKSITQNVSDGLRGLISGLAGVGAMCWVSPNLTGILLVPFPIIGIGAMFYGRIVRSLSRQIQANLGTLTKIAEERLSNVRTSQAFSGELQEVHRYNTQARKIFDLGKREAQLSAGFFGASGWVGNITMIAILYIGGNMVKDGSITVGELSSFLMYTAYTGGSIFGLSGFYSELMKGVGAASRLFELQDRKPTISPTKGEPVTSLNGTIVFDQVAFSYPTRPAVKIFRDLTFKIEPGTNVAVVAPSGAGKSTVASLLMRFYAPTSGTITIAGKDITKMNVKQLRRKIGYVGQEPVLFSGTIAENIAYGRPNAPRSAILNAARRANCTFIGDFPDGLETHVGARGTQLSGGQKQRIAIARALLKEPDILILDEATSALDAESETLVNEALSTLLRGNNTTISIAHRLSTIKRSDMIICIGSDGRVAEVGSYRELSSNPESTFSKLMEWQMNGGAGTGMGPRKNEEPKPELFDDAEGESDSQPEMGKKEGEAEGEMTKTPARVENVKEGGLPEERKK